MIIEIDGARYEVPSAVAELLQSVSEERDRAIDWLQMNATHGIECVPELSDGCECGLSEFIKPMETM